MITQSVLGGSIMIWLDEKETGWELFMAITLSCLGWKGITGYSVSRAASGVVFIFGLAMFAFISLVAIRYIYLRLAPSLYRGNLDKRMNKAIVILKPICVVLLVLLMVRKMFGAI
jgi:hypothetical protein